MIEPMLFYYRSFLTFQVRSVLQEMRELFEANEMEALKDNKAKAAMMLRHTALERNKRCLLAYLNYRVEKIKDMRWQFGAVLPSDVKVFDKIIDTLPGIDYLHCVLFLNICSLSLFQANLCEPEQAFFTKYNRNLAGYMRSVGVDGVDLMTDQTPPKSLYIEVRCLQDYGLLEMDDGTTILLKKNTQLFLPRTQCEQLIRQGILEHIVS